MFLFHAPLACLPCCLVRFIWCGGGVLCVWCSVIGCGPYVAGVLYICLDAHLYGLCYYVGGAAGCRFSLVHVPSPFWLKVQVGLLRSRRPFLLRRALLLCCCVCSVWGCGLALPCGRCAAAGVGVMIWVRRLAAFGVLWCALFFGFVGCCAEAFWSVGCG